jgi:hypothetical protein
MAPLPPTVHKDATADDVLVSANSAFGMLREATPLLRSETDQAVGNVKPFLQSIAT